MIRDPLTGEYALLGTTRVERPNEYRHGREERCAFCPGNEDLTPPEIARVEDERGVWTARAFSNKFPAIAPPDGDHEVIVDARDHDVQITADGMRLWRARYRAALERMPQSYPVLFKNAGSYAGATIVHPHSQLVVLPTRPERWPQIPTGRCVICDELATPHDDEAVVLENVHARAFVRAAGRFSSTLTIAPRECRPSVLDAQDAAWSAVGDLLAEAINAIQRYAGDAASFNVLLYSDPYAGDGSFHWSIEVVPRTSTLAGFELSTGMFIRGASLEESAACWRRMIAPPNGSL